MALAIHKSSGAPAAQQGSLQALCPSYPNCDPNLLAAQQGGPGAGLQLGPGAGPQRGPQQGSPYALCPGYPNCNPSNLLASQQGSK